jgi:hypothetical protein
MVTSGTYGFNPSAGDIVLNAFGMIGVRRPQITNEHLENAAFQANLTGVDFTNRNPNRWQMEEIPLTLSEGQPTYNLPPQTVATPAVWIDQVMPSPQATPISRILGPLSAVDYASIANKGQRGTPNSYFFNLLTPVPTLTLWLVPNQNPEFIGRVMIFKQQQDAVLASGATVDAPYRFLDAFTFGLAARLAVVYPDASRPTLPVDLEGAFERKFKLAAALDQERVPLRLQPNLSSYYR